MAKKKSREPVTLSLTFPSQGVSNLMAHAQQPKNTTPDAENVAFFDCFTQRYNGASRYGQSKYCPTTIVGGYSIQDIVHLVTNDAPPTISDGGQFVYGQVAAAGFSVGSSAGANVFTAGAEAGYAFSCSCWDDSDNVYVGMVNTTTGAIKIYKYTQAGVLATGWPVTTMSCVTASLRGLAGMCIVGPWLVVALTKTAGALYTLNLVLVGAPTTQYVPWHTNSTIAGMQFSNNSKNCLNKIGLNLGVECVGTGTNQSFKIISLQTGALVATAAYGGTVSHEASKVVTDGANYFYTIASVNATKIKKITLGGVVEWSSAAHATPVGLCFDFKTAKLVSIAASSPCVRVVHLTTGATVSSADLNAGAITAVHNVDSDNLGNFTFWRDSVGASDILGTNSSFANRWGPTTFANTNHSGASVNKGEEPAPVAGSRQIRLLVTSQGEVRRVTTSASSAVSGGAAFSAAAPVIFSAQNGLDMFYVDGTTYKYYKSTTNAMTTWTPTAGTLPLDAHTGRARLIERWRGRIVLAGLPRDPQNWFMSAINDSFDWDYSPDEESETQATSGNNSPAGLVGDVINCLISYTDDTFIFGCDHSIWQMTGDPMAGGRLDMVSDKIGMAWGRPFCKDKFGRIYFFSNECGLYRMAPGNLPELLSDPIANRLAATDFSKQLVRMVWDTYLDGFHLFISPKRSGQLGVGDDETITVHVGYGSAPGFIVGKPYPDAARRRVMLNADGSVTRTGPGIAQHFFCEVKDGSRGTVVAWHPYSFRDVDHNAVAMYEFDGDGDNDRVILLGGRDGYLRYFDRNAATDDGTAIDSFVVIGPVMTQDIDDVLFMNAKTMLGETSNDVHWSFHVGDSPEKALRTSPVEYGVWVAGYNRQSSIQRSGIAGFLKIYSSLAWNMEFVRLELKTTGDVRRRAV